jgi:hypothetical protein
MDALEANPNSARIPERWQALQQVAYEARAAMRDRYLMSAVLHQKFGS